MFHDCLRSSLHHYNRTVDSAEQRLVEEEIVQANCIAGLRIYMAHPIIRAVVSAIPMCSVLMQSSMDKSVPVNRGRSHSQGDNRIR